MKKLTKPQHRLLKAIHRLTERKGYPPSNRELCEALGVNPNAVQGHLERLREKSAVTWQPHKKRTLRLTPQGEEML